MPFSLKKIHLPLDDLVPTQPQIREQRVASICSLVVPIVCLEHQGKFYILDGHARSLRAKQLKSKTVHSVILLPTVELDYGIIKTTQKMGLKTLDDIQLI